MNENGNNTSKYMFSIFSIFILMLIFYLLMFYPKRKPLNAFIAPNDNCSYCDKYKGVHTHTLTIKDPEFYYNDASSGVECTICKNYPSLNHIHMNK